MTAPDPNILNPFILLDPTIFQTVSLLITIPSLLFSFIISWHFFRSYKFSGFGYLLGLPVGFVFLGLSFLFEHLNVIYSSDHSLYPILFWIQLSLQSEALALIALSYRFKSANTSRNYGYENHLGASKRIGPFRTMIKGKEILSSAVPLIMIAIPFTVPISELVTDPDFNYSGLSDLSLFMRTYNMAILCYIFIRSTISLVKAANIKLLYIPGAFALLWLEQYSLMITYFDNSIFAFLGSIIARSAGLTLFIYMVYSITGKQTRRRIEIETREKT